MKLKISLSIKRSSSLYSIMKYLRMLFGIPKTEKIESLVFLENTEDLSCQFEWAENPYIPEYINAICQ